MKTRRNRRKGGLLGTVVKKVALPVLAHVGGPDQAAHLLPGRGKPLGDSIDTDTGNTYASGQVPSSLSTGVSLGLKPTIPSTSTAPQWGSTGAYTIGQWAGRTRRRIRRRRGGQRLTLLMALGAASVAQAGLLDKIFSNQRLSDAEVQSLATDAVKGLTERNIPLPPSPVEVVAGLLTEWNAKQTPGATTGPSEFPTSQSTDYAVETTPWVGVKIGDTVTVHANNEETFGPTGLETVPVTYVSEDETNVYVLPSDSTDPWPFPKAEVRLEPAGRLGGRRRRRTARRRKTFRRKT